jgi:hypothetical protein
MTHQIILVLVTKSSHIRDSVINQSSESGLFVASAMIEFGLDVKTSQIDIPTIRSYSTPLHALGDGWKLLAPPKTTLQFGFTVPEWCEWWFTKEV